ncbi:SDR family NAD(P)-dependent oxidoreductase [Arsenicitalea aurantiaca]|nr:SDR family NAD(P)-dependent oxidoreductase [Arsenicitalea aurantiaca]
MAQPPIVVTGADAPLGKATAFALAARGIPLILIAPEGQAGRDAQAELVHGSGNPDIALELADLADPLELREAAERILARHARLAGFVHAAVARYETEGHTAASIEMTRAVNHLAPFLLTYLLLPPLAAEAGFSPEGKTGDRPPGRARILVATSPRHAPLAPATPFDPDRAFAAAQFANVQMVFELSRRLDGSGITANAIVPSLAAPRLEGLARRWRHKGPGAIAHSLARRRAGQGERVAHLAIDSGTGVLNGAYVVRNRPARAHPAAYDEAAAQRLWQESEIALGIGLVEA